MYYNSSYDALASVLGAFSIFTMLACVAILIALIVANWKIFEKASQPGWASIVPFYNSYVNYKIYWGNGWLFLVPIVCAFLSAVPLLGILASAVILVMYIMTCYKKAVAFGQGIGFTIGLLLVGPIFNLILAFGNYSYRGIPQDGFAYSQIKEKVDERRNTPEQPMNYTKPSAGPDYTPNVTYQNPNTAATTPESTNAPAPNAAPADVTPSTTPTTDDFTNKPLNG